MKYFGRSAENNQSAHTKTERIIASRLKALCGGKLVIRSQIGVGTVAKITIPVGENTYFTDKET